MHFFLLFLLLLGFVQSRTCQCENQKFYHAKFGGRRVRSGCAVPTSARASADPQVQPTIDTLLAKEARVEQLREMLAELERGAAGLRESEATAQKWVRGGTNNARKIVGNGITLNPGPRLLSPGHRPEVGARRTREHQPR